MRRRLGIRSQTDRGWLLWAARFGYAAVGSIYIVIGLFAMAVALGLSDRAQGPHGVMEFLSRQPFAPLLLVALALGLGGYAALNITGAITDPERRGFSFLGLAQRLADILTGALYVALAFVTLSFIVGTSHDVGTATEIARKIKPGPFGPLLIRIAGVSLLIGAGYFLIRAVSEDFGEMLDKRSASKRARRIFEVAARTGTAARAIVFAVCGVFAIRSASRPYEDVADVGDALNSIGHAAYGQILLALMGVGFVAYGLYQMGKARYQRVIDA
jgi:hypothetical protein